MFIDQTKSIEGFGNNSGVELIKAAAKDHIAEEGSVLKFGQISESYRMTEQGSFFMPNSTYQKPDGTQEESIIEQIDSQMDMSAANRKNQMVVISNTASPEDLKEMGKDGFSALDADSHTILTVTDKIKAVLARAGVDISIYGDDLSKEQLEAATGSVALANQIASELKKADLPVTEANIEETEAACAAAHEMLPLDDATKEYLLKNQWEPTIKNLYLAGHSGVSTKGMENIDFGALEKQIEKIIKDAGLEVSSQTKESCQWLIEKNIALTVTNLTYLEGLNEFSSQLSKGSEGIDVQQVLQRIMEAIRDGKRPLDALLLNGFSYEDRAKNAMQIVSEASDCDVAYCVEQQISLSVENLEVAISNRGEAGITEVSVEMSTSITFITAKRQLEETRLAMTTEANYALLKRGISIDTKPLEQVVENLKDLEVQYHKDLMTQAGVETTEENISAFSITTKYVEELKYQPAYVLHFDAKAESVESLYTKGDTLKKTMDAALSSYETLWTAPRKDMGDSLQKAFGNVDEILNDLDFELSRENQRAVRILAYNQLEISEENIVRIKDADMEVQRLFRNLTPAATLELIREGHNPLEMEISELNQVVENLHADNSEQENERFSKYLWKLEQNQEISEEERESYIGIYRLIAQVEKTDGAAIGALLHQGAEISMKNLLTAMRSSKKNMDYSVDDNFAGVNKTTKGPRIDHQIMTSFQANCLKEVKEILSPEALSKTENWEEMTPEQLLDALEEAQTEGVKDVENQYYTQLAQEYSGILEASDDVYAFLEKYDIKNSVNNVLAAKRLMENPSNVFDTLFDTEGKSDEYRQMIEDMKNQVLQNFGEAIKSSEAMGEAQATLAEISTRVMQTMIIENETVSVKDLKDLRLMNQQFFLCNQTAKEESYLVPVETGDSVTGISLKIVRGKENKGLVDIFFRGALMEKVAASFEAKENGISGVIATTDEQTRQLFADNLGIFLEKMQQEGPEAIDIRVAKVEDLSMWQFEKGTLSETGEATPVQTKRLYHIAESFIQTVSELS